MSYKIVKLLKGTSLPKGGRPYSQFCVKDFFRKGTVLAVHESVFDRLSSDRIEVYDGRKKDFVALVEKEEQEETE